jgi:hypothetical protein
MSEKYDFGGVSKRIGKFKVRVGQGDMVTRIKAMIKAGHTDIELVEFGKKMSKADICKELLKMEKFNKFTDVINETHNKKMGLVTKKTVKAATKKTVTKVASKKASKSPAKKASPAKPTEKKAVTPSKKVEKEDDLLIEELKQLVV